MPNLIRDGGFSMWFILAFGGVALVTAFAFAVRPMARSERFIVWMGLATLAATLCGVSSDIAATFYAAAGEEMAMEQRVRIAMEGTAESMAPAIVGFAILSLVALMVAVGKRRLDDRRAA
jgi:hypothetical protein